MQQIMDVSRLLRLTLAHHQGLGQVSKVVVVNIVVSRAKGHVVDIGRAKFDTAHVGL